MEAKKLFIKRDVDGKAQVFPNGGTPAVVGAFTYTAKRMGGAPTITATIYYPTPLDKAWTHEEYVELLGEKYYVTSIPSSSKDNQSQLYKHDVTFTSRREVLDNTLFFDAVSSKDEDTNGGDKYRSNQTKFTFGGDITEFVSRINSSMKYCGVPYSVVIDDGYASTEVKEVSFENQYLTEVLQLINTTYELSYYWVGNVCHVGKVQNDLTNEPIEYGRDNALVSVSKENSNAKIIDMVTGYGSSDNIPYYYPNDDEFGEAIFDAENIAKSKVSISLSKYWGAVGTANNKKLTLYKGKEGGEYIGELPISKLPYTEGYSSTVGGDECSIGTYYRVRILAKKGMKLDLTNAGVKFAYNDWANKYHEGLVYDSKEVVRNFYLRDNINTSNEDKSISKGQTVGTTCTHDFIEDGDYTLYLEFSYSYKSKRWKDSQGVYNQANRSYFDMAALGSIKLSYKPTSEYIWVYDDNKNVSYDKCGIEIDGLSSATAISFEYNFVKDEDGNYTFDKIIGGDTGNAVSVTVTGRTWIYPSQNLMPSIYRESGGAERFYYAKDDTYTIPGTADKYTFKNLYKEGNPHQGSVEFSDIKPTINGIRNDVTQSDGLGQLFGEIADVAFDSNDSDVTDSDNNYIHSYFYIKLHKFSGEYGFDLFKHALASENAKINLIKSNGCPACSFDIQCTPSKDKSKMYNCVSTDGNGNLKSVREDHDDYIFRNNEDAYNDTLNQDSTKTELWIAVKKDDSTLGIVMPNASGNFKPQKGDLFVITGIKPPKVLVTAAEKRLDEALIKHMSENNEDKFNFTVKFSRIFLQGNRDFAGKLNENSKIAINYAGEKRDFFISNYTVKVDDSALAEVEVELTDTLEISDSELKKTIDAVKGETVEQLQGLANGSGGLNANVADRLYLSKTSDDTAQGVITFMQRLTAKAGVKFGSNAFITELGNAVLNTIRSIDYDNAAEQGFSIEKDGNGKYHAFLTNLTVWGKALFHELEVRKLSYAGGDIYLSGAGSKIVRAVPVKKVTATNGTEATVTWAECEATDADCAGWKCYLLADDGTTATRNYWKEGDQARCQTMGEITSAGSYTDASNRSYWRTIPDGGVSAANEKIYGTKTETYLDADGKEQTRETQVELYDGQGFAWIVIGKHSLSFDGVTEGDTSTADLQDVPQAGDTIVLDGNRHRGTDGKYDKQDRQNVILLETTGDYAPRIACYANITEYKHTTVNSDGKEVSLSVFETSPKGGTKINSSRFEWISDDGSTVNIINYRGDWSASTTYHKNDQVNHDNAVWVCVANSGVAVKGEEPSDTSTVWKKVLSGGKGEKGDGVDRIETWYMASTETAPPADSIINYGTTTMPTDWDDKLPYLWQVTKTYYTDGTSVTGEVVCIGYKGKDGASGTSYGVALTIEKRTISSVEDDCLVVTFSKGDTDGVTTTNNVQDIGGYAELYVDGKIDTAATSRLNLGTSEAGELSKSQFPQVFTAGYVTVKWYDKEGGTVLGMGSLTRGADGKDATVYGVQVSSYTEWISSNNTQPGLQFGFTKTTGETVEKYTDVSKMGCTVKIYGDDTYYEHASKYINDGNDHFIFSSFPYNNVVGNPTLADKDVISVELYLGSVLVATANYANGKQGTDGKSALEISVNPDTLVFDTDDNGLVDGTTVKQATITCTRNGEDVTSTCSIYKDSTLNCTGTLDSNVVKVSEITSQTVNGMKVSNTNGYVKVKVSDPSDGTVHVVTVRFTVNVAKFNGGMKADNKKFETAYNYLTNDGKSTDFSYYESKIRQTAKDISLHVSEKKAGRRNLLVGSAFRKQEDPYLKGAIIGINDGYEGTNCLRIRDTYSGTVYYYGAYWDGSFQGASSIKIERGKKYTLSVWAKCDDVNDTIVLEAIYTDKLTSAKRTSVRPAQSKQYFKVTKAGEWELLQSVIDTSLNSDDTTNTQYDYMAVIVYCYHTMSGVTVNSWLCRPMLEEGEEYNGWTLSEQDYDYVGGNLLDNTATLANSGNVEVLNGTVTQGGMGESASIRGLLSPTVKETDFLQYSTSGMGLKAGEDYILSFYAKAVLNPGKLICYLYPSEGNINTEDSDGGYDNSWNPTDGDLKYGIVPGTQWKRYWVHWRPQKNDPKHVLFRLQRSGNDRGDYSSTTAYAVGDVVLYDGTYYYCNTAGTGNTPSSSSSYWEAKSFQIYLSQPKLEVGATMTEYTAKRADMVDKQALYATGIDIDSKKITLTASNTTFRDNDGNELAVIDGDGLRAGTIATTNTGNGNTVISGNTTIWYQKDGVTPGIMVFYDEAGVPHFQFCGADGKVKYDFGPSGLQSFISSTQQAYSDVAYLHDAKSYVSVNTSGTVTKVSWCYVKNKLTADQRYVYRKQIPTTDVSKNSDIYDGCVFNKEYSGTNWPSNDTSVSSWLLTDGWYVEPNDGNLPTKVQLADEGIDYDPANTLYYQDFRYYSSGKRTRTVRGYFKKNSNTSDPYNKFGDMVSCEEL